MSEIPEEKRESSPEIENPIVISVQTQLDGYRLRNFYITNSFQGFVWMIFHFSVIFFFTFILQNVVLVGIFLGFANFIAFLVDIPLGILQRYVSTKKMFVIAAISQLIATSIFLAFIFKVFGPISYLGEALTPESLETTSKWFFGSGINYIGIIVASVCYGITKEINDVCTYGYVLSHADPSEYGTILARNNITFGLGSLMGLLLSGVILNFAPAFAAIILWLIITGFLAFTVKFFDNSLDSLSLEDIENFRVSVQRWNKENVKEYLVETIKKTDIAKVLDTAKYIMLKPKQKKESLQIPWGEIKVMSKKEFQIIWSILSHKPIYLNLIWTISLVLTFGFWDTFASSFLLGFLNTVKSGWSYILLACIGIPGILLQEFAGKIGRKIGMKNIGFLGLGLSGVSLIMMGIMAAGNPPGPVAFLSVALINSIGYACGMSTGQNQFLELYNRIYAKHENLTEINANASSGPIKVVQNLANVFGLIFGGLLLSFGFSGFFFVFGLVVCVILIYSIKNSKKIIL